MTILEKIIRQKKVEVEFLRKTQSIEQLRDKEFFGRKTVSLKNSIADTAGIIAEFKRRSPSKGVINSHSEVSEVVRGYAAGGAAGISILTDTEFFGGSAEDISNVRKLVETPVLRKDFMVDDYQFYEAKALGADAVLLIAACLSPEEVLHFTDLSHELELEVLLEIHREEELGHLNDKIDLVGINNRNLKDFKVDLSHSVRLKNLLPAGIPAIAESGIGSVDDYLYLKEKHFDGFLMGEFFMKSDDPARAFSNFVEEINRKAIKNTTEKC